VRMGLTQQQFEEVSGLCADSRSSRPFGAGRFGLFPGYWGFSSLGSTGGVRDESVPP